MTSAPVLTTAGDSMGRTTESVQQVKRGLKTNFVLDQRSARGATLEYNEIKKRTGQTTEIIPLSRMEALADSC
jgi:hypothetical protein